jgi:hypothetical protein
MPVYMRRFYLDQLQSVFDEKVKQNEKYKSDLKRTSRGNANWGNNSSIGSKNPYSK